MLWLKAKAVGVTPSSLLGIPQGTYVSYCLDEAVIYFGMVLESMLEEAGHKPSKEENKTRAARDRLLARVLADEGDENLAKSGYADPALMFG